MLVSRVTHDSSLARFKRLENILRAPDSNLRLYNQEELGTIRDTLRWFLSPDWIKARRSRVMRSRIGFGKEEEEEEAMLVILLLPQHGGVQCSRTTRSVLLTERASLLLHAKRVQAALEEEREMDGKKRETAESGRVRLLSLRGL